MTPEDIERLTGLDLDKPEDLAVARAWRIEGRDSLEWAMGRLAEADAERDRIDLAMEAAIQRVRERAAYLLHRLDHTSAHMRFAVEEYARTHRAELLAPGRKGAKTAHLIHGEIAYRASGERVEVEDEAAALGWARARPVEADLVRVKYELNKRALNEYVAKTGIIPPGCAILPATETITVAPSQPEALDISPTRKELDP